MIDDLIGATTAVLPPTLTASPSQERDTVLPCSALMSEYSKTRSAAQSIRILQLWTGLAVTLSQI